MVPPTNMELRVAQKDKLFTLYTIRKINESTGNVVLGLERAIISTFC